MEPATFKEFQNMGFKELKADPCLLQNGEMIIVCYVDNLTVFYENGSAIHKLKEDLSKTSKSKELKKSSQFLEIELNWSKKGNIRVKQFRLTKTLLGSTEMTNAKTVASPVDHSLADEEINSSKPLNAKGHETFRSIVESLICIVVKTWPNLCVAPSMLRC